MEQAILTRGIRLEMAIKAQQDVEHGSHVGETSLEMMTGAVKDLLQMADGGDQREGRFDQHALVPGAARTELEIGRDAVGVIEAGVGQDDAVVLQRLDEGQKHLVMDVGGVPGPTDRLPARLKALARPDVLILDEMGYFPIDKRAAQFFFQLVSQR